MAATGRAAKAYGKKICARTRTGTPFTVLAVTVAGNVLEKRSHLMAASKVRFGRAGDAALARPTRNLFVGRHQDGGTKELIFNLNIRKSMRP